MEIREGVGCEIQAGEQGESYSHSKRRDVVLEGERVETEEQLLLHSSTGFHSVIDL